MYWDNSGQGLMFAPEPNSEQDTRLWREFREYDANNPHIWNEFEKRTLKALKKGFKKLGAKLIVETIRWDEMIERPENERFKICNNHHAYYARKFLLTYPEYQGIFELRSIRSK